MIAGVVTAVSSEPREHLSSDFRAHQPEAWNLHLPNELLVGLTDAGDITHTKDAAGISDQLQRDRFFDAAGPEPFLVGAIGRRIDLQPEHPGQEGLNRAGGRAALGGEFNGQASILGWSGGDAYCVWRSDSIRRFIDLACIRQSCVALIWSKWYTSRLGTLLSRGGDAASVRTARAGRGLPANVIAR